MKGTGKEKVNEMKEKGNVKVDMVIVPEMMKWMIPVKGKVMVRDQRKEVEM